MVVSDAAAMFVDDADVAGAVFGRLGTDCGRRAEVARLAVPMVRSGEMRQRGCTGGRFPAGSAVTRQGNPMKSVSAT